MALRALEVRGYMQRTGSWLLRPAPDAFRRRPSPHLLDHPEAPTNRPPQLPRQTTITSLASNSDPNALVLAILVARLAHITVSDNALFVRIVFSLRSAIDKVLLGRPDTVDTVPNCVSACPNRSGS